MTVLKGRCFGCRTPGGGFCGGCGADLRDDRWDGKTSYMCAGCETTTDEPSFDDKALPYCRICVLDAQDAWTDAVAFTAKDET